MYWLFVPVFLNPSLLLRLTPWPCCIGSSSNKPWSLDSAQSLSLSRFLPLWIPLISCPVFLCGPKWQVTPTYSYSVTPLLFSCTAHCDKPVPENHTHTHTLQKTHSWTPAAYKESALEINEGECRKMGKSLNKLALKKKHGKGGNWKSWREGTNEEGQEERKWAATAE